jgi:hypothetical protein
LNMLVTTQEAQVKKKCAHFVSNVIRAGGVKLHNTNHAKDMGANLYAAGFREVSGDAMKGVAESQVAHLLVPQCTGILVELRSRRYILFLCP